jgi:hypothetical protein
LKEQASGKLCESQVEAPNPKSWKGRKTKKILYIKHKKSMQKSAPVDVTYFRAYIIKPLYTHGINDT